MSNLEDADAARGWQMAASHAADAAAFPTVRRIHAAKVFPHDKSRGSAEAAKVLFLLFTAGCGDFAPEGGCLILLLAADVEGLYQLPMIFRTLVLLVAVVILAGCPAPAKKTPSAKGKKEQPQLKDQTGDASFQAFVGRLQKAVQLRDKVTLASMMAPDFGYRWDNAPEGETVFAFWDRHQLWGQLSALLRERWTPHDAFMVVPPQFAQSDSYPGFRAGLTMVNGSWRFAYFVPAPPADGAGPEESHGERPLPPLPE